MPRNSQPIVTGLWTSAVRLALGVVRGVLALLRALAHRRAIRDLSELDERALKDIGLTRADILGALGEPLNKDPSAVLLVRSVERRARSRAMAVAAERRAARRIGRPAPVVGVIPPARAGA